VGRRVEHGLGECIRVDLQDVADRWQFIDRESGVCGVFGTQVFPPGDPVVRSYMKEFEDVIYSKL